MKIILFSERYNCVTVLYCAMSKRSPLHVTPSPLYPVLQAHVKDPSVLVQEAFGSHGDRVTHSSMSAGVRLHHIHIRMYVCMYVCMYICRYCGCMSVLATQLQQCHCRTDRCSQHAVYSMLHTVTCPSVSTVSCVAFTSDRPKCVGAGSV